MKILLFGKNGQLGWELNRSLMPLGDVIALGREEADFTESEVLRGIVRELKPDIIVNSAAYTAVDKAEEEERLATVINAEAPGILAQEAKGLKALLVHYSTDYVFDGTNNEPYTEEDTPGPINAYGRSKLAGDEAVISSGCDYLILRTSWVYSTRGHNFLLSILKLASERKELNVVDDQTGSPTWARTIAEMTGYILSKSIDQRLSDKFISNIYNIASDGAATWLDFSRLIMSLASSLGLDGGFVLERLNPISGIDYPAIARRPGYTVLSTDKAESAFGLAPVHWKEALECCMASMRSRAG